MIGKEEVWKNITKKYGLKESDLSKIASAWHTDLDLSRPIEVVTDVSKSRKAGFSVFQSTEDSFINLFEKLKREKIIP